MTKFSKMALLVSAMGLAIAAGPASAQSDDNVIVTAPHFRSDSGARLGGTLQSVSLSSAVRYDDLNLRTRRGARELRIRVRDEAQNVCTRIGEAYPVREAPGTSCYKTALNNGLIRADAAIRDARDQRYSD